MSALSRAELSESLIKRLSWDDLDLSYLRRLVEIARDEDLSGLGLLARPSQTGDRSTAAIAAVPRQSSADLVAREPMVVCGLPLLALVLTAYGGNATVQLHARDGRKLEAGAVLATLTGDPRVLLAAERIMLNFLQRLSGVATQTRRYADALGKSRTRLLDTRKTTPGYRVLEKYAVACGGGWNHRLGLFDRVMLKDNHLALLGFAPEQASQKRGYAAGARKSAIMAPIAAACPTKLPPISPSYYVVRLPCSLPRRQMAAHRMAPSLPALEMRRRQSRPA